MADGAGDRSWARTRGRCAQQIRCLVCAQQARTAMRQTGPIGRPRQREALCWRGLLLATPPVRRRRHGVCGHRPPEHSAHDPGELQAQRQRPAGPGFALPRICTLRALVSAADDREPVMGDELLQRRSPRAHARHAPLVAPRGNRAEAVAPDVRSRASAGMRGSQPGARRAPSTERLVVEQRRQGFARRSAVHAL